MEQSLDTDALDGVAEDMTSLYPDLPVIGLPITGRIVRLAHLLSTRYASELAQFGLSPGDFDFIATMRRRGQAGTLNARDLQRSSLLSSGGTTKRLDRLENAGLLERLRDPNDRRGVLVQLTDEGVALADQAIHAITTIDNHLINATIEPATQSNITGELRKMLIHLEDAAER